MKKEVEVVYVVIGESENVYQDEIDGPWTPHPKKEIVRVFRNHENAKKFIENCKLKKPERHSYGDTSYYKGGYMEMEIETFCIE